MQTPLLSSLIHTDYQQLQLLTIMYTIKLPSLFIASTAQKPMNGFNHWWKRYLMRYGWYLYFFNSGWVTRWVSLVEQKLVTLPKHLSSTRFLVGFFWVAVFFCPGAFFKALCFVLLIGLLVISVGTSNFS